MSVMTEEKRMLNVRVDEQVMRRLDDQLAQARRAGRKMTKERLVADAIMLAYPGREVALPVHEAVWAADIDPRSNTALLDLLDDIEATA